MNEIEGPSWQISHTQMQLQNIAEKRGDGEYKLKRSAPEIGNEGIENGMSFETFSTL